MKRRNFLKILGLGLLGLFSIFFPRRRAEAWRWQDDYASQFLPKSNWSDVASSGIWAGTIIVLFLIGGYYFFKYLSKKERAAEMSPEQRKQLYYQYHNPNPWGGPAIRPAVLTWYDGEREGFWVEGPKSQVNVFVSYKKNGGQVFKIGDETIVNPRQDF